MTSMRIVIPDGDYWFCGFGTPAHLEDLWQALIEEVSGEVAVNPGSSAESCDADLRLGETIAAANEWLTRVKRETLGRTLKGPFCTRAPNHAGRHVALGHRPQVVAAWPGAYEPTVAELDLPKVLDDTGQAQ